MRKIKGGGEGMTESCENINIIAAGREIHAGEVKNDIIAGPVRDASASERASRPKTKCSHYTG